MNCHEFRIRKDLGTHCVSTFVEKQWHAFRKKGTKVALTRKNTGQWDVFRAKKNNGSPFRHGIPLRRTLVLQENKDVTFSSAKTEANDTCLTKQSGNITQFHDNNSCGKVFACPYLAFVMGIKTNGWRNGCRMCFAFCDPTVVEGSGLLVLYSLTRTGKACSYYCAHRLYDSRKWVDRFSVGVVILSALLYQHQRKT